MGENQQHRDTEIAKRPDLRVGGRRVWPGPLGRVQSERWGQIPTIAARVTGSQGDASLKPEHQGSRTMLFGRMFQKLLTSSHFREPMGLQGLCPGRQGLRVQRAPLRCPGCPASPGSNPRSSLLLQDARRDSVGLALSGTHLPFFHRADIKHDKICVLLLNTSSHSSTSWYHGFLPLRGVLQGNGSHLGTSPGSCRSHFNKHPWSGIVWRLI